MWKRAVSVGGMVMVVLGAGAMAGYAPGGGKVVEEKYDSGKLKARYSVGADGVKQGAFQVFDEEGKVKETGDYVRGELDGTWQSFFANGKVAERRSYKKGVLDGGTATFDDKGGQTGTGTYRAGKKSGIFREFAGGKVVVEQLFVDDMQVLPRSEGMIAAKLGEIRRGKVATVKLKEGETIPPHRGAKQSEEDRAAMVRTLEEYRYLSGVPWDLSLDPMYDAEDEAGSALLAAIGKLDHQPANPGWAAEEYEFAKKACGSSNLSEGAGNGAGAVRMFMNDSDMANVDRVGHRRWCLNPGMLKTGFGITGKFGVMWSFDQSRTEIPDFNYVAYPGAGLFPTSHMEAGAAWSVSLNPKKYKEPVEKKIKVSVKAAQVSASPAGIRTGAELKVNYFHVDNQGFGIPNAIIFRFDNCAVAAGATYLVEISGLETVGGEAAVVKYVVEFFNLPK